MADDDQNGTEDQPDENGDSPEDQGVTLDDEHQDDETDQDAESFPRSYVEKLRKESKGYRDRAKTAEQNLDATLHELFTARVTATGKLADPDDLAYDAELLADDDKLTEAVDELIKRKPHLAKRRVGGPVGQGVTGTKDEPFSLLGRLQRSV